MIMCSSTVGPIEGALSHSHSNLLAVHDFPQLYQKPSASALLEALALLSFTLSSSSTPKNESRTVVSEAGVPRYLTLIVSSSLSWIQDEDLQESIWSVASTRLSERSGRNAMPATTRSFRIDDDLVINLHEPTLTEDNLGLKTWMSSLLLSRRLRKTRELIPGSIDRVLELGAGTGLVGIAAASLWKTHVVLTDLPNIVSNLQKNLDLNRDVISHNHGSVESQALDWSDEGCAPRSAQDKFKVVLAADPIYSSDHPKMLVNAPPALDSLGA